MRGTIVTILLLSTLASPSTAQREQHVANRRDVEWLFKNSPQYVAPVQYDVWWDELVLACGCTPVTISASIVWRDAPSRGFACPVGEAMDANTLCVGQWLNSGDIFIATRYRLDERVVKHEMLHAILGVGNHPAIFAKLNLGTH
jgi:hypothetical protein